MRAASGERLRDAVVDVARRGERESGDVTRAAADRKGTFYICNRPTVTSLQDIDTIVSFIGAGSETISLVARAVRIGGCVAVRAINRSDRRFRSGKASEGALRAGKSCQRHVGREQHHETPCVCPAAILAPPFCRGSKGASRMRTPARNPCGGNDPSRVPCGRKQCLHRGLKDYFYTLPEARSFVGQETSNVSSEACRGSQRLISVS